MNERLEELINEAQVHTFNNNKIVKDYGTFSNISVEMQSWVAAVEDFIREYYGENSSPWNVFSRFDVEKLNGYKQDDFEKHRNIILSALSACKRIPPKEENTSVDATKRLGDIFKRFHLVAKQLRNRYNNRPTLDIEDEYDVQDLLHALLRLYFEDIRNEEWTPSYAGGSSRMDFLLKEEKTVIEVKKTRKGLSDKELGKQLIEDKEKYKSHPDCNTLICFTYDPEGRIVNPKGIQNDLNKKEDQFEILIVIKP